MANSHAMSLSSRFVSGFKWNLIGQILSVSIGLLLSAVIARGLGPDDYGLYASVVAIIAMIPFLVNLGFETIINVRLPVLMINAREAGTGNIVHFIRSLFFYRLIVSLCACVVLYFFASEIAGLIHQQNIAGYLRVASICVVFTCLISLLAMVFTAQLKIMLARILGATQQIIILLFAFILLKLGLGIYGVIYAMIIGSILSFLIYIFFSRRYLFHKSEKFNLSGFYKIGLAAWAIGFVSFALGKQTDIILLNYFGVPSSQVGFYNIAFTFSLMLSFLGIGIGPISQAIFSESYEKSGTKGLADSWYIIAKIGILFWFPVFAFALLYVPSIITIIYGEAFSSASGPFRILAGLKMVYVLMNASFAMPVFYLISKKRIGLCLRISAGILNLILDIILIPKYGVLGAVYATGASMALIGILEIGVVIKSIQARLPLVFYSKIILVFGLALLPTLLIGGETIIPIILKGVIYGISSIMLMWLIKPMEERDKLFVKSASEPLYQLVRYF
jgi:O-antigen/teichoic acid export membrane protein